jgi:hypothetical protein
MPIKPPASIAVSKKGLAGGTLLLRRLQKILEVHIFYENAKTFYFFGL